MNKSDPIKHLENIKFIEKYIKTNNLSYGEREILVKPFGISRHLSYSANTPEQIQSLANYIRNYTGNKVGLYEFFHSPHAVKILENNPKYENLNVYLKECLACIGDGNKVASIILMRCCVEELMAMQKCEKYNLGSKIQEFIKGIEQNKDFEIFTQCNKQEELKIFLDVIKDLGNDAVHTNGKSLQAIASKYEIKEMFKLFCILIELSIMKGEIQSENDNHIKSIVESINFSPKVSALPAECGDVGLEDDIPF